MKKFFLAIAAVMMMSASVMAQEDEAKTRPERKQMDKTEMVKMRTDNMVKQYGLNEEQAKQLLDLNTKYADNMGPQRGPRQGRQMGRERDGQRRGERMMRPDSLRPQGQRPQRQGDFEEMRKQMEAYDAELKSIMTEEQYQAYKAEQEKRMRQGGPRGPHGGPRRNNMNRE